METVFDVTVIGAGASGLVCALTCARGGKKVILLEKEPLPARKILASGNGRCNFTNRFVNPTAYHGEERLIKSALTQFPFEACLRFFDELGVLYTEEANGRFFPATGKATAIADVLKIAAQQAGVEFLTGTEAAKIKKSGEVFSVQTVDGQTIRARRLVLACGSCAYPQLSGTDSGYKLAKSLGHSLIYPRPALAGLCLKETALQRLTGVRAQVRVTARTAPAAAAEGEVIFTNYGINGPAALNVSAAVSRALDNGPVTLELNFFPQLENAREFFKARFEKFGQRTPKDYLSGALHESIANLLIDFAGLRKNKTLASQPPAARERMVNTLLAWPVTATALRPWNEAMVAAGGVNTREINYNTFESLCCPHLFITGELLDVDGKSGGFNLHFAWASGYCAAQHIVKEN